jgi:pimeloyl-ACP methyl ester carboxylesterase
MSNSRDEGGGIPLLICSRKTEFAVSPLVMRRWSKFLKKGYRLGECQNCRHFFHHFSPKQVGEKILNFWLSLHSSQANFNF